MRLYRNSHRPAVWFAFSPETGWVMFPAEAGGWSKRQPARGIDPIHVREVPLRLAFNTGMPGAPCAFSGVESNVRLGDAA